MLRKTLVPTRMIYSDYVADSGARPLNGNYDFTFTIQEYRQSAARYLKRWSEDQSCRVTNGHFQVTLGDKNPLDEKLFSGIWATREDPIGARKDDEHGLRLRVSIQPRKKGEKPITVLRNLVTVPYAFRANRVNRFPTPDYDSGWVKRETFRSREPASGSLPLHPGARDCTLRHGLGGDTDEYVVDLTTKDERQNSSISCLPFHLASGGWNGAWWHSLTDSEITVEISGKATSPPLHPAQVRVRIWRC